MTQETTISLAEVSFKDFLFKNKRNRTILSFAAIVFVIQFSIFKYFYPFANFIHGDSFFYIKAAKENLDINLYPIGYSKFLRLFSVFTNSDTAVVGFQYLFIQTCALLTTFTLFYFSKVSKITQYIILSFIIINPLFLHLSNLISSDCLFTALSFCWFSLLLWIINKPSIKISLYHGIVLFIAFTFRYNALIYPIISIAVLIFTKLPKREKLFSMLLPICGCAIFIIWTSYLYKKETNYWQFSPFAGWQLTNNAMYAYRYVNKADRKRVPEQFQLFDSLVRKYFDSTRNKTSFTELQQASTAYMWSKRLTMYKYRDLTYKNDTISSEFKKWAAMGPFYRRYGLYIMQKYPLTFIRYFIWPNAQKYFAPPVEYLEVYNSGKKSVTLEQQQWFNYKSEILETRTQSNQIIILNIYPILSGVVNLLMAITLLCYLFFKKWIINPINMKGIILGATFWLSNAGFTIFASSAALRYQSFPITLTFTLVLMLIDWLWKLTIDIEVVKSNVWIKKSLEEKTF